MHAYILISCLGRKPNINYGVQSVETSDGISEHTCIYIAISYCTTHRPGHTLADSRRPSVALGMSVAERGVRGEGVGCEGVRG